LREFKSEPKGLGGWLILVGIGLFITPFFIMASLLVDYVPIFTEGYWEIMTTPGSEGYHPLWAPVLTFEIIGNTFFILFGIALVILFFTKSPRFPKLLIVFYASNLLFIAFDLVWASGIPAVSAMDNFDSIKELVQAIVKCAIWIPYMLVSKRVKNTFVRPRSQMTQVPIEKAYNYSR
jgi:hypothetical protein